MTRCSVIRTILCVVAGVISSPEAFAQGGVPIMELEVGAVLERGLPIAWHSREVVLLRTDGSIKQFEPHQIDRHEVLQQSFQPETAMQLRGKLQQEFGRGFAVDGSGDFVIVAPPSKIQIWRERFAQLQRAFDHYFRTRGYPLKPLDFPLVGIVFPDQAAFQRHSIQMGLNLPTGVVGYYSPVTNRLYAYEMNGHPEAERESLATIRHEAAHQIAFNRGVHQRLSGPPLWLMEGLASIFEAEGMMSQRSTLKPSDLINRSRWDQWNQLSQDLGATSRIFEQMLVDDRFFQRHPSEAYAVAWAVSLYLAERDTKSYINLLRHYSKMEIGDKPSAGQRMGDFKRFFSGDHFMLIKATDRFLSGL